MKRTIIVAFVLLMMLMIGCGENEISRTGATGEGRVVEQFLDKLFQKGDLNGAYDLLTAGDRAMLGMIPGFYDFMTNQNRETIPEELLLLGAALKELTPFPRKLLTYTIGPQEGAGDTLLIPVTFSYPVESIDSLTQKHVEADLLIKMRGMDESDLSYSEKESLIRTAILQFKKGINSQPLELRQAEQKLMLIKENGQWKVSIASSLGSSLGF